jgi:hypothetical protein
MSKLRGPATDLPSPLIATGLVATSLVDETISFPLDVHVCSPTRTCSLQRSAAFHGHEFATSEIGLAKRLRQLAFPVLIE